MILLTVFVMITINLAAGFRRLITIRQRHREQMADISVMPDENKNDATDTVAGR